ncbi:hypothetical protein [Planktotalea sp.]|uniref:hypothetical protein n=1 Tax=Planktotalea sp. TaxID=2029877 RepID=UPI002601495E|nr:hypothetical protein [Planktotalea sp.]
MLARLDITTDEIERVTEAFYAKVRSHETLGPVSALHVKVWPIQEAKITRSC